MSIDQGTPAPPVGAAEALAMVTGGLAALAAIDPVTLTPDEALEQTRVLLLAHDQVRALALRGVADVEHRQLHALDECPSTGTWVVEQATSFGRDDVGLARKLDRVPHIAARIAEGGLTLTNGVRISKALGKLRPHLDRPDGLIDGQPAEQALHGVIVNGVRSLVAESRGGWPNDHPRLQALHAELTGIYRAPLPDITRLEQAFLVLARTIAPGLLHRALDRLVDALLPAQLDQDAIDDQRNRYLQLTKDPDRPGWDIRGHADDETGDLLHTVLTAAMATDPDNPLDTQTAEELRQQGLDPYSDGCVQIRTKGQRLHDALRLVLQKTLASNALGVRGKAPITMSITVSSEALHGVPGALPATGSAGQTLPISLVRRLACEGTAFTRFIMSLGNRVIASSHTSRTLSPHERKIKRIETGGICEAAGCTRGDPTGDPLIPHHIEPHAKCGTTSLADTAMFCDISHADLHHGKTIRLKNGRRINENGWVD